MKTFLDKEFDEFLIASSGTNKGNIKKSGQTFDFVHTGGVVWTGTAKDQTHTLKLIM